jgi:hypothetical protein
VSNFKFKKARDLRSSGMLSSADITVRQALKTPIKFKASEAKYPFVLVHQLVCLTNTYGRQIFGARE